MEVAGLWMATATLGSQILAMNSTERCDSMIVFLHIYRFKRLQSLDGILVEMNVYANWRGW